MTHAKSRDQLSAWAQFWSHVFKPVAKVLERWTESRQTVRYSLLALNVLMLGAISLFVVSGPADSSTAAPGVTVSNQADTTNPLDQLSSAEIAINASLATGLPETVAVINQADSEAARSALASADTTVVAKQQAVATDFKSAADIKEYTVKDGDTLASIAAQFGVTSDSISWSNDLNGNSVNPGDVLLIPPVNGIVYTVAEGDTPDSLASRYGANREQLIAYNDIELTGSLEPGQRIILPGGRPPAPVVSRAAAPSGLSARYGYNGYDYGYCTWWVANRRAEIGRPLPSNLGNACTWASRARSMGLVVNNTPAAGAAIQTSARCLGHVAFVERVNPDGSVLISEMNSEAGWGRVNEELIPASQAGVYTYIH